MSLKTTLHFLAGHTSWNMERRWRSTYCTNYFSSPVQRSWSGTFKNKRVAYCTSETSSRGVCFWDVFTFLC